MLDREAGDLVAAHDRWVHWHVRFVLRLTPLDADYDDACQEVRIVLLRAAPRWLADPRGVKFADFARRAVRWTLWRFREVQARRGFTHTGTSHDRSAPAPVAGPIPPTAPAPVIDADAALDAATALEAAGAYREFVRLHIAEGRTHPEVADLLGTTLNAARYGYEAGVSAARSALDQPPGG